MNVHGDPCKDGFLLGWIMHLETVLRNHNVARRVTIFKVYVNVNYREIASWQFIKNAPQMCSSVISLVKVNHP